MNNVFVNLTSLWSSVRHDIVNLVLTEDGVQIGLCEHATFSAPVTAKSIINQQILVSFLSRTAASA